jgi:hypothetical protein
MVYVPFNSLSKLNRGNELEDRTMSQQDSSKRSALYVSDLLSLIDQALAGDTDLRVQLSSDFTDLANNSAESTENRAIGRVFAAILNGERQPDLTGLRPDLARLVSVILPNLQGKGA